MSTDRRSPPAARALVALAAAAFVVSACGALGDAMRGAPQIWDVHSGRFITEQQLVDRLSTTRFRLLGEVHDNPAHHRIRAKLLREIAATGRRPAIVFEQFDLDRDAALVTAQADGKHDADSVATAGAFDRKAWQWPLHRPILAAALDSRMPIHAGNAPRAELMRAARAPAGASLDTPWAVRFAAAEWSAGQETELRRDIADSHCGKLPDHAVVPIARAQRMRDAAMAQALADAAASSRDGAILIAGNGHARNDLAVPVYLRAPGLPGADATIVSVGLLEADADDHRAPDFPRSFVAERPGYDVVWLTPASARGDPCEQMPAAMPSAQAPPEMAPGPTPALPLRDMAPEQTPTAPAARSVAPR